MMTLEHFSGRISQEVENAKEFLDKGNVLDLRAGRSPYHPWDDLEVFSLDDVADIYDFVKDSEEWYVDVYENIADANYAEFTGFAVVSWE